MTNYVKGVMALAGLAGLATTITAVVAANDNAGDSQIRNPAIASGVLATLSLVSAYDTLSFHSVCWGARSCAVTSIGLIVGLGVGIANVGGIGMLAASFAGGLCAWGAVTNGMEFYNSMARGKSSASAAPLLGVTIQAPPVPLTAPVHRT